MSQSNGIRFTAVAQISRSVGIKGEVKVQTFSADPARFDSLRKVYIGDEDASPSAVDVESVRWVASTPVLKLIGISSREQSDALRGQFLYVAEQDAVKPKEGSYFIHDIVGMEVVTEEGKMIGKVKEVYQLPANDVWLVEWDEKDVMIPATKEVIQTVDHQQRRITIHAMEGLIE